MLVCKECGKKLNALSFLTSDGCQVCETWYEEMFLNFDCNDHHMDCSKCNTAMMRGCNGICPKCKTEHLVMLPSVIYCEV
jgi:hypothetical protein